MSKKPKVWKDRYIIDAYEMAKLGYNGTRISQALGISYSTFVSWKQNKRLFYVALAMGHKYSKENKNTDFSEYIYNRLPDKLKKAWQKINKLSKCQNASTIIRTFLQEKGTTTTQYLFLYALTRSAFNVSTAMKKLCISKSTFDQWQNDPVFKQLINEVQWHKKNFFEDHLTRLVKEGDSAATIFANKTLNKDRGYQDSKTVDVNVSGSINHNYITINELDLSFETKKEILKSIRKLKTSNEKLPEESETQSLPLRSLNSETVTQFAE
jgi:hypothetical protein